MRPLAAKSPVESQVGDWLAGSVLALAWGVIVLVQALGY